MTFATSGDIAPALSLLLRRPLQTQINWSTPFLAMLPVVSGTGKQVNFTAQFSGAADASAAAEGARVAYTDADNEIEVPGSLAWAYYHKVAAVTGLAKATSSATRAAYGNASLVGSAPNIMLSRIRTQHGRLLKGIHTHLFSGNETATPKQVGGIARSIKGDTSYGGIDPGTYAEWVSTSGSVAAASLSFDAIRSELLTPIYEECGEAPTYLLTDPETYDILRALYGTLTVPYVREIMIPGIVTDDGRMTQPRKLDIGAQTYCIDGIPVFRDPKCTAGKVYAINANYLYLEQLNEMPEDLLSADERQINEFFAQVAGDAQMRLAPQVLAEIRSEIRNPRGLVPYFKRLGAGGDSDEVLVKAYCQTVNTRRNAHGVLAIT